MNAFFLTWMALLNMNGSLKHESSSEHELSFWTYGFSCLHLLITAALHLFIILTRKIKKALDAQMIAAEKLSRLNFQGRIFLRRDACNNFLNVLHDFIYSHDIYISINMCRPQLDTKHSFTRRYFLSHWTYRKFEIHQRSHTGEKGVSPAHTHLG